MRKALGIFVFVVAVILGSAAGYSYSRTDDLSLTYQLWKAGIYPYHQGVIGGLVADREFQESLVGKTVEEIRVIFPNAHYRPANDYQLRYENTDLKGREYLWLGEGGEVLFFENGICTGLGLMKG